MACDPHPESAIERFTVSRVGNDVVDTDQGNGSTLEVSHKQVLHAVGIRNHMIAAVLENATKWPSTLITSSTEEYFQESVLPFKATDQFDRACRSFR